MDKGRLIERKITQKLQRCLFAPNKQVTCDLPHNFRCTQFQLPDRMNRPTQSASVKTGRYSEVSWANFNSAFP
jgi:hypothetical protein